MSNINSVILSGRLTRAFEEKELANGGSMAKTSIAVDRFSKNGEQAADFIPITFFGKPAERVMKTYGARSDGGKGQMIIVRGRINTGSYTNNAGVKVYTTDVIVDDFDLIAPKESGGSAGGAKTAEPSVDSDGFLEIPDGMDEELPFN